MKTFILSFILVVLFFSLKGQNSTSLSNNSNNTYSSERHTTDSVKSGNELYDGRTEQKKITTNDTLKGIKKTIQAKPNGTSKQTTLHKNRQANTGNKINKKITLVMSDFKS